MHTETPMLTLSVHPNERSRSSILPPLLHALLASTETSVDTYRAPSGTLVRSILSNHGSFPCDPQSSELPDDSSPLSCTPVAHDPSRANDLRDSLMSTKPTGREETPGRRSRCTLAVFTPKAQIEILRLTPKIDPSFSGAASTEALGCIVAGAQAART
jgi:hypothetical protein